MSFMPKLNEAGTAYVRYPWESLVTSPDGLVATQGNKRIKLVAGVIRNLNDGNGWQLITNATHSSVNVDSVSNDTSNITVNFGGITAAKVVSFVAAPDETLARAGFFMGSSVGVGSANIQLKQRKFVSDYVSYSGSAWSSTNGVFTGFAWAAGTLTLTHESVETSTAGIDCSVTPRDGVLMPVAGSATATATQVKWLDWAGALQTTESTNMKAYVSRGFASAAANPNNVHEGTFPSSNIWFMGEFELP